MRTWRGRGHGADGSGGGCTAQLSCAPRLGGGRIVCTSTTIARTRYICNRVGVAGPECVSLRSEAEAAPAHVYRRNSSRRRRSTE